MANVLPPDLKNSVRTITRAHFILATAFIALIGALVAFLMLLPSWFALAQNLSGTSSATVISPRQQLLDKATFSQISALISQLAPIALASTTPPQALIAALSLRPAGVSVNQIVYTFGKPSQLVLYGSAQSTADISMYSNALASNTIFTSATVPVDALVGAESGHFTLTLTGNF